MLFGVLKEQREGPKVGLPISKVGVARTTCYNMLRNAVRRYSTLSPTVVLSSLKERGLVNNSTKWVQLL